MPDEKLEEETYSLIFTSLKHPIRRKILRMLANEHLTFSEILEPLSIDSGHLGYHLENLGDLITRSQDGKYCLSSIGIAAVKLMTGVEEHPAVSSRKESKIALRLTNIYLLILMGALISASLYFVNYTVLASSYSASTWPGITVKIPTSQTFEFNITIVYSEGIEIHVLKNDSIYHERKPPIRTLTMWETGWFWFDLESNETLYIFVTLCRPDGTTALTSIGKQGGIGLLNLGHSEIVQAGTYKFEIENDGPEDIHGLIKVNERWELFERRYFYYGIAGLFVALLYPMLILLKLLKDWRLKPISQVAPLSR